MERPAQAALVPGLKLSGFPRHRRVVMMTSSAPTASFSVLSAESVLCCRLCACPPRSSQPGLSHLTLDSVEGPELTSAPVEAVGGPGSPWLGLFQWGRSFSNSRLRAEVSTRPPLPPSLSLCSGPQTPQLSIGGSSRSQARARGSQPRRPWVWAA